MTKLAGFSGQEVVAILEKHFVFFASQKGSHIKLKRIIENKNIVVIVPNHKELAPGTLRHILNQAKIQSDEFINAS